MILVLLVINISYQINIDPRYTYKKENKTKKKTSYNMQCLKETKDIQICSRQFSTQTGSLIQTLVTRGHKSTNIYHIWLLQSNDLSFYVHIKVKANT